MLFSAIFASIFLKEKLDATGKVGCLLSLVGALLIVLHAPEDKEVTSIDELLFYALQPGKIRAHLNRVCVSFVILILFLFSV